MNKSELIAAVAETTGLSKKDSEKAINAALDSIVAALKNDDKVQIVGFGAFEVKKRAARTGRNPQTKQTIEIPASKTPVFKAGKARKEAVE
jgi:DNA-binding protein HU-beta